MSRPKFLNKTKFQMQRIMEARAERNGILSTSTERSLFAGWVASIVQVMDLDELKDLLLYIYSNDSRLDVSALEVISNEKLAGLQNIDNKPSGLKFKNRV